MTFSEPDVASQPPREILSQVATALEGVESYHVDGMWVDRKGRSRMTGDVTASGSMRLTVSQGRTNAHVVHVGSEMFFKANGEYWLSEAGSTGSVAALLADRWVALPRADAASMKTRWTCGAAA